MNVQDELAGLSRRAFLPKCVIQLFREAPALSYVLAGGIGRTLKCQGLYFRGRAVGRHRRILAVKGFSAAVKYGIVLQ